MSWARFADGPGGTEGPYSRDSRNVLGRIADRFVNEVVVPVSYLQYDPLDSLTQNIGFLKQEVDNTYRQLSLLSSTSEYPVIQAALMALNVHMPKVWELMDKVPMPHPDPAEMAKLVEELILWHQLEHEERRKASWTRFGGDDEPMTMVDGHPICAPCLNGKHDHPLPAGDRTDCKNTGYAYDVQGRRSALIQCQCGFGGQVVDGPDHPRWVEQA